MAKTLDQIQEQIARLQKQAEAIKAKEVGAVIGRIKDAIAHYGLTAADIFDGGQRGPKPDRPEAKKTGKRASAKKSSPVPIKYRDGAGNTWTGRGLKPRWLAAALAEGKSLDDFAVKS